jgi:nucleoside-diphosphate-sugar epimerase
MTPRTVLVTGASGYIGGRRVPELLTAGHSVRYLARSPVPVLTPRLSSYWVGLVTPLPIGSARPLIETLENEVVVHDDAITRVLPRSPVPLRAAIELALARTREVEVTTSRAAAELGGRGPADPVATDPDWSGGIVFDDTQTVTTSATPSTSSGWRRSCPTGCSGCTRR